MNKQDLFDKVAIHLLTQKERSMSEFDQCAYRNDYGLKCAIGCLIPDELYNPSMEGFSVLTNTKVLKIIKSLGVSDDDLSDSYIYNKMLDEHQHSLFMLLLVELQRIHDGTPTEDWKLELIELAKEFNLSTQAIDNI